MIPTTRRVIRFVRIIVRHCWIIRRWREVMPRRPQIFIVIRTSPQWRILRIEIWKLVFGKLSIRVSWFCVPQHWNTIFGKFATWVVSTRIIAFVKPQVIYLVSVLLLPRSVPIEFFRFFNCFQCIWYRITSSQW